MKKVMMILIAVLALWGLVCYAQADTLDVPDEVSAFIAESKTWKDFEITGWAAPNGGDTAFAAVKNGRRNDLLCFERGSKGVWAYQWHNAAALPQVEEPIVLSDISGYTTMYDERQVGTALNSYYVINDELMGWNCIWENQRGTWRLVEVTVYEPDLMVITVSPNQLHMRNDGWVSKPTNTVIRGVVETDLRYVNIGTLPVTVKDAQERLSMPPEIPEGELTAERIKFTSGKKYKVYRGPGEAYGQAANGKASVSTNDWIQVFGREGDWIMIQYDISSDHMRIGWIDAKALPKKAEVPELVWRNEPVSIPENFPLTDDPLFSGAACAEVRGESVMTWLGTMGDWAYVEAEEDGAPVRGFIALDRLSSSRDSAIMQLRSTLLDTYGYTEDELADFMLRAEPNILNGWTAMATNRRHTDWRYEMVFDETGGCTLNRSPFKAENISWFNEGVVRGLLRKAEANGWFAPNWNENSRKALLDAMAAAWVSVAPTAALQTGDLTAEEAVRELFISYFGPVEGWPQALAAWCQEEMDQLAEGGANG